MNSSTRGFLTPGTGFPFGFDSAGLGFDAGLWAGNPSRSGQPLDDFMQQVACGVTGLPGNLVFPRWQEEPPNLPDIGTNWAAVGVTRSEPWGFPVDTELTAGAAASSGYSQQSDQEEFDVLCSFYGHKADGYAVLYRQGLMVAQNRECLQLLNIGLVRTSGRTRVPSLVKQRYLWRVDITATFLREVRAFYPVLYFLSSPIALETDTGVVDP